MSGCLQVLAGGLGNTIQDAGRTGYRQMGIAVSGFLDPVFAACANALVGNAPDAACLEMRLLGPELRVRSGPLRLALCGAATARIVRAGGGEQDWPAWQSATLQVGDTLRIGAVSGGTAYLAVSGGVLCAPQLGSRSTYLRAGIGGIGGRALAAGDLLPCRCVDAGEERIAAPWPHEAGPLRVLSGPQREEFAAGAWESLLESEWTVTRDADRMGLRLAGPALVHGNASVSDGVAPGAIQVAGGGQPIVLLADCQTVGGYPKIATVISADLPRLAQCRPGQTLRFAAVDLEKAAKIRVDRENAWWRWQQGIARLQPTAWLDEAALYSANLISGVVAWD